MLLATSTETADANARVVDVHGQRYVLRGYIGAAPVRGTYVEGNEVNANELPQGFLVDQPPGSVTPPHFHETEQYQVFVGGSGRLGKKTVLPLSVQFAGGHTPYGPIVAGDDGIRYYTLRHRWDPGAKYLPAMRDRFVRGRQRQRLATNIPLGNGVDLSACRATTSEVLIAPEADGLCAGLYRGGPGASLPALDPADGGGQYYIVVNGTLEHAGEKWSRWSCLYATRDERLPSLTAGPEGLELLVLRFPRD